MRWSWAVAPRGISVAPKETDELVRAISAREHRVFFGAWHRANADRAGASGFHTAIFRHQDGFGVVRQGSHVLFPPMP